MATEAAIEEVRKKAAPGQEWAYDVYRIFREQEITQFAYVPDAGHRVMIDLSLADPDVQSVPLTTEEEGVALACGAHLGGARAVTLMQSSGAGNCVNMFSLPRLGRFPFLTLLSMRGDFGEGNPWQMPMGKSLQKVLEACDVVCLRADTPDELISATTAGCTMAFKSHEPVAILMTQRLLGAKSF